MLPTVAALGSLQSGRVTVQSRWHPAYDATSTKGTSSARGFQRARHTTCPCLLTNHPVNEDALISRQLCEGDIVKTPNDELAEVSSISIDGRIYFKGGSGQCAWPDLVTVQARADDLTAEADCFTQPRGQRSCPSSKAQTVVAGEGCGVV